MESKKIRLLNKLSFGSLIVSLFISVFAFLPYSYVPIEGLKGFVICIGVTLSILFWFIARLTDGKFVVPKDRLLFFALLIPLSFLVSSLFSFSPYRSIFGIGFEVGTFGSMLIMFLVLFLSSIYFQNEEKIKYFFRAVWVGGAILALFEITHIIFNFEKLSPGLMKGLAYPNLFGTWNDFAVFFGFIVVLSLLTLQLRKLSFLNKSFVYLMLVAGLFFLSLVNSWLVWVVTGVFSLIVFVYTVSFQSNTEVVGEKKVPFAPFLVILVSLLFVLSHNSFGVIIPKYFGLINNDVYPSLSSTFSVAGKALMHNPFFGIGPNTFEIGWSMWKPQAILASQFSGADFYTGFGFIPTLLVTVGLVGFLSVILFFIVFILRSLQSIKVIIKDNSSNYLIFSTVIIPLYFFIIMIFGHPNFVSLVITAMSIGAFIGILSSRRAISVYDGTFLDDPRKSFFAILSLVVLMIVSVSTTYVYTEKFTALSYFAKAQSREGSANNILKAVSFDANDTYYRALSQTYLSELINTISNKNSDSDLVKSKGQELISKAENAATLAINSSPKFYKNWVNMGDMYNTLLAFGINGSYENALDSYNKALELSPNEPSVIFSIATLDYKKADYAKAIAGLEKVVKIKPSYLDARYVLALSYQKVGQNDKAREQLTLLDAVFPNNKMIKDALNSLSSGDTIAPLPDTKIKKVTNTKKE